MPPETSALILMNVPNQSLYDPVPDEQYCQSLAELSFSNGYQSGSFYLALIKGHRSHHTDLTVNQIISDRP